VPEGLLQALTEFLEAGKAGQDVAPFCLPGAVEVTKEARPEANRARGKDINLPFLKGGASQLLVGYRKEADDCYMLRTESSAIWWVETKSGKWLIYAYLDKPRE